MSIRLTFDYLWMLSGYVSPHDLLSFGSTCHELRQLIRFNERLWRLIVTNGYPHPYWMKFGFNTDEWIKLAFTTNIKTAFLQCMLRYRLHQPQSSLDSLRIYAKVCTPSLIDSDPVILVTQDEHTEYDGAFVGITFKQRLGGSFLYWRGQSEHMSHLEYYIVDRLNPGINTTIQVISDHSTDTILGRSEYARIGMILHQNATYYDPDITTSYDGAGAHGAMRMGYQNQFGANSTTITRQMLAVSAYHTIIASFEISDIIKLD